MTSFPLLKLPLLALNRVLQEAKPLDLINLSKLSRTTKFLVKHARSFYININESETNSISLKTTDSKYWDDSSTGYGVLLDIFIDEKVSCEKISNYFYLKDQVVPVYIECEPYFEMSYNHEAFEGKLDCYCQLLTLIFDTFTIKFVSFDIFAWSTKFSLGIMKHVKQLVSQYQKKSKVQCVKIWTTEELPLTSRQLSYILDNTRNAFHLIFYNAAPQNFRYDKRLSPKNECYIQEAPWLRFGDLSLLMVCCKKVTLLNMELTSEEIHLFLKEWMRTTVTHLLDLHVKDIDLDVAMTGVPVVEDAKELKSMRDGGYDYKIMPWEKCFKIIRNDGKVSHIWSSGGDFYMQTVDVWN